MGKANVASGAPTVTILFISLSAAQYNLETDWAEAGAEVILRRCPICVEDSIVGHGRRRKQAHDEHHDWIGIRRGVCNRCGKTFTFLPPFSPPYGHYSLTARSQALCRYFDEGRGWEAAAPAFFLFAPDDGAISVWLRKTENLVHDSVPLRWHTTFVFLARFWPLRI